jgi:hypothetical protein
MNTMTCFDRSLSAQHITALLILLLAPAAVAQEVDAVLTGYGTTGYGAALNGDYPNDFTASFTPVTLFQMGDDLLFEGEIDFSLHGGSTDITLEHAQVHYLGFERVQVTAGKFHLPFGIWMHPTWVNKMPDPPLLYGHTHGGVAENALLPILFDVGVMTRGKQPLSSSWALTGALWVSQGPQIAAAGDGHGHGEGEGHAHISRAVSGSRISTIASGGYDNGNGGHEHPVEVPSVAYGTAYTDINTNKMIGAQLRLMNMGGFMIHLAGFHGTYDGEGKLPIGGVNLSLKWQPGAYDFRGEGILLRQEFPHAHAVETVDRGGYYLQLTRRLGGFEPVVRWSHLLEARVEETRVQASRRQLALGLNYWITPSMPVKLAYELGLDGSDEVLVQWAFGF